MHRRVYGLMAAAALLLGGAAGADSRKQPPQASELPPSKLSLWLDGFHYADGHPQQQTDVHHFCMTPKDAPIQCALFDGFGETAKLMGVEYIIDEKTFRALPEAEKRLWHSHVYEATSGALVLPGMSEQEETKFLEGAMRTYGKTWHTWDMALSANVPMGRPALQMSFTRDGVLEGALPKERDERLGVNTQQLKANRAKAFTEVPKVLPGADKGEGGRSCKDNRDVAQARRTAPAPRP